MKPVLITSLMVFMAFSCNNRKQRHAPAAETPRALTENKSDISIISKRNYEDLAEQLYDEQVSKSKDLKEIEQQIKNINEENIDSLSFYKFYTSKSSSYYNAATAKANTISDSLLKKKMLEVISLSEAHYKNRIAELSSLVEILEKKSLSLNDYHIILKIKQTLPLMEKYQENTQPSSKSIKELIKKFDQLIEKVNTVPVH